jgi:hypothetical protein
MNDMQASTSWTPARGDVVGWPFVWKNRNSPVKLRPCLVLNVDADKEEAILLGLGNPTKCNTSRYAKRRAVEVRWDSVTGNERRSVLYPCHLEFNIAPVGVMRQMWESQAHLMGTMGSSMLRKSEQQAFGLLKAGLVPEVHATRWVEPGLYKPATIRLGPDNALVMHHARYVFTRDTSPQQTPER